MNVSSYFKNTFWTLFVIILALGLSFGSFAQSSDPINYDSFSGSVADSDIENLKKLSLEEQKEFLIRRQQILIPLKNQMEKNALKLVWFQWTKDKISSPFKPSTWKAFVDRVFAHHQSDLQELKKEPSFSKETLAEMMTQEMLVNVDKKLWENLNVMSSAKEWSLNFGIHLVTFGGFRKYTQGLGLAIGLEVATNFKDRSLRITPYIDLEHIKHAVIPMIAASVELFGHFVVNGNDIFKPQSHQTTSLPGGLNKLKNNNMFGFGLAWGVGLPPVLDQFAYYRLDAKRFRFLRKKQQQESKDGELFSITPSSGARSCKALLQ